MPEPSCFALPCAVPITTPTPFLPYLYHLLLSLPLLLVLPCPTLSCPALPCRPYPTLPHPTLPYPTPPYPSLSCPALYCIPLQAVLQTHSISSRRAFLRMAPGGFLTLATKAVSPVFVPGALAFYNQGAPLDYPAIFFDSLTVPCEYHYHLYQLGHLIL